MEAVANYVHGLAEACRVPDATSVTDWVEGNVVFSPRFTGYSGPVRIRELTPHIEEILETLLDDNIGEVTLMTAAQVAKTSLLMLAIAYVLDQDPSPTLFVIYNDKLAASFSDQRLMPMIEDCPLLNRHIPSRRKMSKLEMSFDNMSLALVGANSPGNLSSRPVRWLFLDEIDKYPVGNAREASAVKLAEKRVRTFWNAKLFKTSTPTNTEGQIWQSFIRGDQRFLFVPCPHCNHYQPLVFGDQSIFLDRYEWEYTGRVVMPPECREGKKWIEEKVVALSYYECGYCKKAITDADKPKMVKAGEWRPQAPGALSRSYHLSALYAFWPSCSFGRLAWEFCDNDLQDFCNSTLGEPWEVRGDAVSAGRIHEIAKQGGYKSGTCPQKPLCVIITADVQKSSVWYVVRAWCEHETSYLIRYGVVPDLDDVAHYARQAVFRGPDGEIRINEGFIDSGDRTDEVYLFCDQYGWIPIKGFDNPRMQPLTFGPAWRGRLMHVDSHYFNDALEVRMKTNPGDPGSWNLPEDIGEEYSSQVTAEAKIRETDQYNRPKMRWKRMRPDNHLRDCEKYQVACAEALGVRDMELPKPQQKKKAEQPGIQRPDGRGWWEVGK